MTSTDDGQPPQEEARSECAVVRTHGRFLLRQLEFTRQFASMYRCRLAAQQQQALAAVQRTVAAEDGEDAGPADVLRMLEMKTGEPAFSVGVLYKQMKLLPRFLDEYQRELVRIDAGDEDGGDEGADDALAEDADAASGAEAVDGEGDAGQERAASDEHFSICHQQDELMLEDSSGRVALHGLQSARFCTGMVIAIYGTLLPSGHVQVHRYAFGCLYGAETYVPRPPPADPRAPPCYIAFVCGLNVDALSTNSALALDGSADESGHAPGDAASGGRAAQEAVRVRALLELLVDFISGAAGDAAMLAKSRCISRLVIGGNSIAPTEELKLKKKVKLDPSDHVRLNDDRATAGIATSAKLMRELDGVLARLAETVEVELMPGDNDMSDAFQPQQPLHPVLLPKAGRYSTLRLVTNPFEFTAVTGAGAQATRTSKDAADGVQFFVSSGQNINDVARETQFETRLGALGMVLSCGCACPTAPNTLFSYPFRDEDPFLLQRTPHCFVACDQPHFETRYVDLTQLEKECAAYLDPPTASPGGPAAGPPESADVPATRLICVPSFARTGTVVLVDVHSPTLETSRITFGFQGSAASIV